MARTRIAAWSDTHGRPARGASIFTQPTGVAVNSEGEVFVENRNGILKLSAEGEVVAEWPDFEESMSRLTGDTEGNIYVRQQFQA